MAVYTSVTKEQLSEFLNDYSLGHLRGFEGIGAGIENTNYFVTTDTGRYVLTIFERLGEHQLPFYLGLMQHLAASGLPCPDPQLRKDKKLQGRLLGKPCAIVDCLPGAWIPAPSVAACAQVGDLLARMHLAAQDYPGRLPNQRDLHWCEIACKRVLPFLDSAKKQLLETSLHEQLAFVASGARAQLPAGSVHGDLFRDNVLFDFGKLSGAIDFYFAGYDTWLYDLATTVNDWCIDDDTGALNSERYTALMNGYAARRPLLPQEQNAWPLMTRMSALRFWLSRLDDWHSPRPASQLTPKDPSHFERILQLRTINPAELPKPL
jgi:homoserine kinase type II